MCHSALIFATVDLEYPSEGYEIHLCSQNIEHHRRDNSSKRPSRTFIKFRASILLILGTKSTEILCSAMIDEECLYNFIEKNFSHRGDRLCTTNLSIDRRPVSCQILIRIIIRNIKATVYSNNRPFL